jgi:glycerol-3-phosphate acyltransferase PlsX
VIELNGRAGSCTVAVDAMGGDNAPDEILKGAAEATVRGVKVILVGQEALLEQRVAALGLPHMDVVDAVDVIPMDETLKKAIRRSESSLHVALRLVNDGGADAVVSAGNSAAIMAVSMLICKRQPGIDRPAFGSMIPTLREKCMLLDVGANSTVTSENLVQFAIMGEVFVRLAKGIDRPTVALLNNGEEEFKGTQEIKDAAEVLRRLDMNFVGNIEGNHVFDGNVDVIVCDGFTGNVLLKGAEGVVRFVFSLVRDEVKRDLRGKLAGAALQPAFGRVRHRVDYQENGGAPVLGVNKIVINCHGRSQSRAIASAICQAQQLARDRLVDRIGEALHHDEAEAGRRRRLARALHLRSEKV